MTDYLIKEDVFMALTGDITDCTIEEFIARLRDKLSKLPSIGKDINVTTNEDCISRQAVLALPTSKTKTLSGEIIEEEVNIELIKALPSVVPKEKTVIETLEKIKKEIKQIRIHYGYIDVQGLTIIKVLEIIDKHLAELEGDTDGNS